MPNVECNHVRMYVWDANMLRISCSYLSLEEGVAVAAAAAAEAAAAATAAAAPAAVSGVGLAVDGHAPHHGVTRGQVPELRHDLTTADLLRDMLGLAVRLGHAVEGDKNYLE